MNTTHPLRSGGTPERVQGSTEGEPRKKLKVELGIFVILVLSAGISPAECIVRQPSYWATTGKDELNLNFCWKPREIAETEQAAVIHRKREALCIQQGLINKAVAQEREAKSLDANAVRCRDELKIIEQEINRRFPQDSSEMKACLGAFRKTEPLSINDDKWLRCGAESTSSRKIDARLA